MHFGMHIAWAALNWELKCLPFSILFPTATTLCNKSTSLLNTDPLNTTIFCTMLLHAVLSQGIVFLSGYLLALCKGKPKQEAWGWEEKNNGCGEGRIMENQEVRKKNYTGAFQMRGSAFSTSNSICIKTFILSLRASRGCRCSMLNANENWKAMREWLFKNDFFNKNHATFSLD